MFFIFLEYLSRSTLRICQIYCTVNIRDIFENHISSLTTSVVESLDTLIHTFVIASFRKNVSTDEQKVLFGVRTGLRVVGICLRVADYAGTELSATTSLCFIDEVTEDRTMTLLKLTLRIAA